MRGSVLIAASSTSSGLSDISPSCLHLSLKMRWHCTSFTRQLNFVISSCCTSSRVISFGKFAFEGLLQNEFGDQPYGSRWSYYGYQSMDPELSKWTNLLALGLYPFVFHALAFVFTFLHTRPRSFWTRFDSEAKRAERVARARLEPPPGSSAPPTQQL